MTSDMTTTEHRGDLGRLTLAEAAAWYRGHALPDQKAGALAVLIQYIQYGHERRSPD